MARIRFARIRGLIILNLSILILTFRFPQELLNSAHTNNVS